MLYRTPEEDLLDGKLDQPVEPPSPVPTPTPSPPTPSTPNPDPETPPEPREPKPDTPTPSPGPIRVPPPDTPPPGPGEPDAPLPTTSPIPPSSEGARCQRLLCGSRGNTPYVLENAAWTLSAATPSLSSGRKNPKLVWTGRRARTFLFLEKERSIRLRDTALNPLDKGKSVSRDRRRP